MTGCGRDHRKPKPAAALPLSRLTKIGGKEARDTGARGAGICVTRASVIGSTALSNLGLGCHSNTSRCTRVELPHALHSDFART